MAKVKIEVKTDELKNLDKVLSYAGIKKTEDVLQVGENVSIEVDFKSAEQLFKAGRLLEQVSNS